MYQTCKIIASFSRAVDSEKHSVFLQNKIFMSARQRRRTPHGESHYCSRIPLLWKLILQKS